jgi:hypothetical protein
MERAFFLRSNPESAEVRESAYRAGKLETGREASPNSGLTEVAHAGTHDHDKHSAEHDVGTIAEVVGDYSLSSCRRVKGALVIDGDQITRHVIRGVDHDEMQVWRSRFGVGKCGRSVEEQRKARQRLASCPSPLSALIAEAGAQTAACGQVHSTSPIQWNRLVLNRVQTSARKREVGGKERIGDRLSKIEPGSPYLPPSFLRPTRKEGVYYVAEQVASCTRSKYRRTLADFLLPARGRPPTPPFIAAVLLCEGGRFDS